ncbi:hypothetical protein CAPTEDRAFT_210525 [Capitella teleta]|uniref:G-protein coupled receptors family 1 profile domain-containing protein n=1 Tax=Capitella teleta TaxID=283909 RepID=R7TX93_CAPTE|nr:hypothetical protein CAPTEDRAFT_210525 [Capitella teleta]|eukprot:ELT95600.1 hypothetical protein CAPTEDRAFT_210525 [Capitella teleta]
MDNITSEPETASNSQFTGMQKPVIFYSWYHGILGTMLIILMAGIPGNVLTILAYFKEGQLRSPTNLLICSQSIGDLFTCLVGPLFTVLIYTEIGLALTSSHKYLCVTSLALVMTSLQSSVMNIIALCSERFIAVFFSLRYYDWVTDVTVKGAVVTIWTMVILINCLPLFGLNKWKPGIVCKPEEVHPKIYFQGLVTIPIMFCLMICAMQNIAIAVMAVRKQRSISPQVSIPDEEQQADEAKIKSRNQFKVTKMLLLVVGCFYTTWLPWIVCNSIYFSLPSSWRNNGVPEWFSFLNECSALLLSTYPIVNPFIYGWKNLLFRDAYYKLLGIKRG